MSSVRYISHFAAASTPLSTSQYVRYHAQSPNAPTAAVYWVKHPSSQLQLKHNRHIFSLPQHNLQNISTVSEGGSTPHGPHILHSIIFVLHLVTEDCVLVTKTGQLNKSRTSITYSSYKYLHTPTLQFLAHFPHFTETMAQCPQVSLIWASPPLTALQLIQYIYMHTYTVRLSPSQALYATNALPSLRNVLRPCGQLTPENCEKKQLLSANDVSRLFEFQNSVSGARGSFITEASDKLSSCRVFSNKAFLSYST
jgi:hypothetical protein